VASNRRTAAAALAVVLAAVSLYPVFIGLTWFWAGCGSVAVVALAGTATRLRRLPVPAVLVLGVVALLLYLNLAFSNGRSLAHLLPTPASLAELCHLAGQGFTEASRYAPPVPQLRGMVLLAAAGIGIAALATDLIAVRLGSAALAGLPLLLLVTEPFTLSVSRGWIGTIIAFCAAVGGYLTLLSSEARDRIRDWEHRDQAGRGGAGAGAPDTRPLAAAGRRVGFASIVVALCLPLAVPGLHATRLFGAGQPGIGGSGGNGGGAGFPSPLSQVSSALRATAAAPVLDYTTSAAAPDYLRIYALDKLTDNGGWQLFGQPVSLAPVEPRLPAPPGLASTAGTSTQTTSIALTAGIGDDSLDALPVPYPATTVKAAGTLKADRSTLMVFDSGIALGGLRYTVTSLAADPSAVALNRAAAPPADIATHDLSVPASYEPLAGLAGRVAGAAGAKTPFQEAVALQDWLAGGSFSYTLNAPSVVDAAGLKNFLTVTRKGYCQQFAYSMAVLARLLGIPSRVAVGFTAGTRQRGSAWLVTTHDAHAWPELYFQGYGWLRFEPTPSGSAGQGSARAPGYSQAGPGHPRRDRERGGRPDPQRAAPAGGARHPQQRRPRFHRRGRGRAQPVGGARPGPGRAGGHRRGRALGRPAGDQAAALARRAGPGRS
jgi:transglutaminase-like putative cysteine protease